MSTKNKLPQSVILALKNVSRRCALENASFAPGIVKYSSGESISIDDLVKEEMRLYLCQDTKAIIDFLIRYGEGKEELAGNSWIETL